MKITKYQLLPFFGIGFGFNQIGGESTEEKYNMMEFIFLCFKITRCDWTLKKQINSNID